MKKINVKVTVFLSVIVLAVIILLLNFIEFRKTLDFTASGIRMLKENASGKRRYHQNRPRKPQPGERKTNSCRRVDHQHGQPHPHFEVQPRFSHDKSRKLRGQRRLPALLFGYWIFSFGHSNR